MQDAKSTLVAAPGIDVYSGNIFARTNPHAAESLFDVQPKNFKVRLVREDLGEAATEMAAKIAEHINLATTGVSNPAPVWFEAKQVGDRAHRLLEEHNSTLIKKFANPSGMRDSEINVDVLKFAVVDDSTIEVSTLDDNTTLLDFAKKAIEAGLPFPKRK